jgi:deoxycytidine triphosphate deaminase
MSVLSDRDIIRELGKGILFHPLKAGSINACDLRLTASEYAYAIGLKQRLIIQSEPKKGNSVEEQKFFEIPPRDTALVWTDESVYLSDYFRGPISSTVGLVSKGTGHIGTRVNPCWSGVLCVTIHNLSDNPLRINVRDVNRPIAYLAIDKLSSRTSINRNTDKPARLDVLSDLPPNKTEIHDYFNQREHSWMTGDTELLKKLMLDSEEYKKLTRGFFDTLLGLLGSDTQTRWTSVAAIGAIISAIFAAMTYLKPPSLPSSNSTTITSPQTQPQLRQTVSPN